MSIEEYNEELNKIKQFHSYLGRILDNGYMNDIDDLKNLTSQINNISTSSNYEKYSDSADFIDENDNDNDFNCITFIPRNNNTLSESPSSSDTEDSEEDYKSPINKEQQKIDAFIKNSNDIFLRSCNISLYKANGFDYINTMNKFIQNSFIY